MEFIDLDALMPPATAVDVNKPQVAEPAEPAELQGLFNSDQIKLAVNSLIPNIDAIRETFRKESELKHAEYVAEFEAYLKDAFGKISTAASQCRKYAELNPIINRPWRVDAVKAFELAGYQVTRCDSVMMVVKFIKDGEV